MWQANFVKQEIEQLGHSATLVAVKSAGDKNLLTPLYELGVQGIFTKTLDTALLNREVDIVVHSLKDVPTQLPKGIRLASTPKRGNPIDVLVTKREISNDYFNAQLVIGSSSLRRKSQWLHRYPHHTIVPIRGNINTRLSKLIDGDTMDGVIFAAAGIERIDLEVPNLSPIDFMVPAPAQGTLGIFCREEDEVLYDICQMFHDENTGISASVERQFLRHLMGGCSKPIGAYACIEENKIQIKGNILSLDGINKEQVLMQIGIEHKETAGSLAANYLLKNGGQKILDAFPK